MKIALVIPALNEERFITACLDNVSRQPGPMDVVVVDGGSTDRTVEVVSTRTRVLQSETGRACQMDAGAADSDGAVILFLHADSMLPSGALDQIREALSDPNCVGGCFRLRFDRNRAIYRFYTWCARIEWPRIVFGDRAIFVRRSVFESIGGFGKAPLFEDVDFFRSMARRGKVAYLKSEVVTSSRRFEESGRIIQQFRNTALWILHNMGVSASWLARFYPARRRSAAQSL